MDSLLELPWQTLLTLASGYAGYYVANTGIRDHHRQIDVMFHVLLFGFFSQVVYQSVVYVVPDAVGWATLSSFALTVCTGAVWRRFGRVAFDHLMRWTGVSYADDTQSALHASYEKFRGYASTQITVWLQDGSCVRCEDTSKFNDQPMAPYYIGNSGDLVLYPTHEAKPGEDAFSEIENVIAAPDWGVESQYIPADQIRRIAIRHMVLRPSGGRR